jgi:hypothetical protein
MLVLVFMQTFEFFVKKMNISGSKVDNLFVCYSMVLCFSIAVMSACLLTAVLVVCECAVMADSGNPVICRLYYFPRFYSAVSGSYRINNIAGGKFLLQIK